MKIELATRAKKEYRALPDWEKRGFKKQVEFLLQDIHHPSLKCKKYITRKDNSLWQARINRRYHFYFHVEGNLISIVAITDHSK